jgi:hypothetical protein
MQTFALCASLHRQTATLPAKFEETPLPRSRNHLPRNLKNPKNNTQEEECCPEASLGAKQLQPGCPVIELNGFSGVATFAGLLFNLFGNTARAVSVTNENSQTRALFIGNAGFDVSGDLRIV